MKGNILHFPEHFLGYPVLGLVLWAESDGSSLLYTVLYWTVDSEGSGNPSQALAPPTS